MRKPKRELIQYYREGWRAGYVVRRGYKWVKIRRILPYATSRRRGLFVKVKLADTREVA